MDPREFPTKGNLMLAKNSLMLARQGYDLMDKKRNILLKELMGLIDEAKDIQEEIDATFTKAYACLQLGCCQTGRSDYRTERYVLRCEMYGRRNEIIDGNSRKYRKSMGTAQADSLKLLSLHTVHFINICSKTSHDQTRRNYCDHKKSGIIGCGNMGGAILYGALDIRVN